MSEIAISSATKTVLHVGCGSWRPNALHETFQKPEWQEIRLDISPKAEPDIVASMTDMGAVETGSVDAVWSSHSLEHLSAHEVPIALSEFHRVLRPGGSTLLRVPDIEKVAELILSIGLEGIAYQSPSGPITPLDMLFGHGLSIRSGGSTMLHKTGFTAQSLENALSKAGFSDLIVERRKYDLWALGKA